ncbi:hypothetical protein C8Q79DRAFT_579648 [Trametes meyenii]|nr:hypothetical protein C8Q79DRAFT_579648 [Trametes meyenii]
MAQQGRIDVSSGWQLTFDSPLDRILVSLLSLFQARYKLLKYEKDIKKLPEPPKEKAPRVAPHAPSSPPCDKSMQRYNSDGYGGTRLSISPLPSRRLTLKIIPPTPEDRQNAALVSKHVRMASILNQALKLNDWTHDKVGDQVSRY